ncbi:hypothetical protein EDB19DRAFT_1914149 [Suillus lakei]|nr:hypothetical protein EDB19DRAFT_1914149 [Suillus lakei]
MSNDIPALDRRAVAKDLADRLQGSLDDVLGGMKDILKFSHLEDHELQRHSRKIITLTELARNALERERVALSLFIHCPEKIVPYKSAYFKLLLLIRSRKLVFPVDARTKRLLFDLGPNVAILCEGIDPRAQLGYEEELVPTRKPLIAVSWPRKSSEALDVMLPPDALAKESTGYKNMSGQNLRIRHQLLSNTTKWAPPGPRKPFIQTKAQRFEVVPPKQSSSLYDLFRPSCLD